MNAPWAQYAGVNAPLRQTPSVVSERSQQQTQVPQQSLGKGNSSCLFGTTPPGLAPQQQQTPGTGGGLGCGGGRTNVV